MPLMVAAEVEWYESDAIIGWDHSNHHQGQQRFAPLNSWPDNQNLDKARRLLCQSFYSETVKDDVS